MMKPSVDPSESAGKTPTSLLRKVVDDEPGAWEALVRVFGPLIYHWCRRWGLQPEDAEIVGNEVLYSVSRKIRLFERRKDGAFHGWLWVITRHAFLDHVRKRARSEQGRGGSSWHQLLQEVPAEEMDEESEQNAVHQVYKRVVELIHGEFSDLHFEAFQRTVVQGQRPADVAADLGTTRAVVYNAVARIRKRVNAEFGDLLDNLL